MNAKAVKFSRELLAMMMESRESFILDLLTHIKENYPAHYKAAFEQFTLKRAKMLMGDKPTGTMESNEEFIKLMEIFIYMEEPTEEFERQFIKVVKLETQD